MAQLKMGSTVDIYEILHEGNIGVFLGQNEYYGLSWNKTADTYTRTGRATNMIRADFDTVLPWANIRRCNLSDLGVVNAYYGDVTYTENGSNGQVMVQIPKFWYKVNLTSTGYEWQISPTALSGYKVHPAFVRDGVEKNFIYISAFEGCAYDVSGSAYNTTDASGVDFTATTGDKLSSISGTKPISGKNNSLTIANIRQLAKNRGTGWGIQDYLTTCAIQLLYLIEYGNFNSQSQISIGVTNITDDSTTNMAIETGYTGSRTGGTQLGNASGQVVVTHYQTSQTTYAMSYRGIENFYGNIWKFIDGINIKADRNPWISDHDFVSDTFAHPYNNTDLTLASSNGYVSDITINNNYDYGFLANTVTGSSSTKLTDYYYQTTGNMIALFGAGWPDGSGAGAFFWYLDNGSGDVYRTVGGRLLCVV